jgi:hypothetical protein
MNPLTHSKNITLLPVLLALTLACFALSPQARAVCQQGCDLTNFNTFLGDGALSSNTSGSGNTATGSDALLSNTTGGFNTANGFDALVFNTTGLGNTACGVEALTYSNGNSNTSTGYLALHGNGGNGNNNTANGVVSLTNNYTGNNNTAIGYGALSYNTTGDSNIALGYSAGSNVTTGKFNIDIGNLGKPQDSFTTRIGKQQTNTYIAGISGVTVAGGLGVVIDTNGHLGTVTSSARYKENIKPMEKASEAIFALKPVTFRYKHELDADGIPQFGLVAEDVEKINPDLVARDERGKPYTVRYEAVNAMLLNEFLKEHKAFVEEQRKVQEQGATIARLEQQIEALTSGLQKVTAQLEVRKPVPQTAVSNP